MASPAAPADNAEAVSPWHHRRTPEQPLADLAGASLEWGMAGALAAPEDTWAFVVVDILSFTTAVTVAVSRGIEVIACPDTSAAHRFAAEHPGTAVGVARSSVDADHPWSLSPAGLARAPVTRRLALPSPNVSAVAAKLASARKLTVACSLRNVTAVASWLARNGSGRRPDGPGRSEPPPSRELPAFERPGSVVVVAAGERWPDGSLRPAIEDSIGAGLLLHRLSVGSPPVRLSPAAALAARSVRGLTADELAALIRTGVSGTELTDAGYDEDVEMAVQLDADSVVPIVRPAGGFGHGAGETVRIL